MSITYVSIDSKDRNKESKYLYSSKVSNIYNKASIELNSNELKLNSNNHGLSNGDKVSLEIVEASSHTLQNPFIYKNYNGTIFVYVYHPNVIDTVPLFDPNYNSVLNIVIEDFEYPSGTANFSILTNNGTLELELSSLTHNLGSSENLTDLLKLNDKIQLDIDSDFISNNQIYTVYHLDTTTKIARVRCTHPKVEKFNSATCQWSFVNTLNNQNTIADIHSYFHLIQPPKLLYLELSEFNALGLSNGWFLDWYKFELPSFISHSVSANTLIKNINFGGNVKIKLDTGIVHLSNNPLIITKNSNQVTLMEALDTTIHSDEVELHNIQPVSNVISNIEPVETKTYLKFTHDDLNKNFPVNLDILVNNYITFDFSESLTSVIAFKDGGLVNNDSSISFRVLKVNVFKQITLDLLYEIDTDLSYITNGLKWTAIINNTPYKGYVKTPIEYLPKEINQIKVGLSDSTVHYEKTYTDNVFMKITLGNTTNKSGFKVNTTGVNIGDNIEITTDTTDYIEFGDGSRIDNLNLSDSIIQEKLWTKYTIKGTGTKTFVFNESITFINKANDSVNGIIYSNIPVDINNTYRVTVTGSSTAPANIWTGIIQSEVLSTTSSTISSEFIVTGNTLEIGIVFNTGTAVDSSFNITSILLQKKVNQQFEVVAKSGNDLTLNAQKVITDIDSSNNSFKVNGNVATIDKTPIDITKAGNNKNSNVSINDINIKINRSNSTITYLDDEVESRSVVNGTIFDYQDSYVLIKLEKDIKGIILSGTPTFEFVGPDRVLYTGEINTANIVSEANSYFFRNMIDTSDKLKFNNVGINFKTEALNSNTAFDIVDFDYAKDEATINLNREIKNVNVINDNLEDINIVHLNNISSTEQANWSLFMNDFNTNYKVIGSNATSLKLQGSLVNKHNVYRFGGRFGWLKWKDNIGGIHNNYLNADLPQLEKEQAYHEITNVNGDNFSIILSNNAKVGVVNGGDHIRIKQILDNVVGYPNPNSYRIYLQNPISNVISVKMESTEFTNTSFIITDSNNKIYWQNELDGDYVYNVTLNNGYYYYDTLANEIQNKMGKVNRIYDAEGVTHKVLANVNTETQEFTLQSYNEVILNNPVSTSENSRVITISHNNHGLTTGDTITIFDSISVGRIPSTQINGEHEIIVLNDNAYTINVTTPSESALLDQGGTIFAVLSYNKIRLRLDYENTIGNILGFDNTDIQDYSIKVSNKEYNKGLKHINLFGNRYILMKCKTDKDFGVLQTNSLRDVFAKIQLNELINNNIFNSFISRLKVFTDPITIEFIDIELYDENGKLFDFSDLDHSFTISVEQRI